MARITRERATQDSNKVVKRNGGNSPARHLRAVWLALESSIGEKPLIRRPDPSHTGRGTASRKHGKAFCRLGQPEDSGPELISIETQAPTQNTCQSSFLIPPNMISLKIRPRPWCVLRKLKEVTKASIKPATRMQSLSRRTTIWESRLLKIAVGKMHSLVPGQKERRWSNRVGPQ